MTNLEELEYLHRRLAETTNERVDPLVNMALTVLIESVMEMEKKSAIDEMVRRSEELGLYENE